MRERESAWARKRAQRKRFFSIAKRHYFSPSIDILKGCIKAFSWLSPRPLPLFAYLLCVCVRLLVALNEYYYYCYFYLLLHCHMVWWRQRRKWENKEKKEEEVLCLSCVFQFCVCVCVCMANRLLGRLLSFLCYQFIRSLWKTTGYHDNWQKSFTVAVANATSYKEANNERMSRKKTGRAALPATCTS